ncbi:MAG TPA: GYDIA family GHMP kinase [Flavobacteriaceae bacterium]|nr:GYDIA family GHMP kinase [Flavobacteriaceae bacterium]
MPNKFHSNGKLLLTGEYVVLDGAKALAVPTKFGQSMEVSRGKSSSISWKSLNEKDEIWFQDELYLLENGQFRSEQNNEVSNSLKNILQEAFLLNPNFFNGKIGVDITTKLEFPQNWGLGSSSTLISNIAEWLKIDAYKVLENTFGGSGYDLACAKANAPISYQLTTSGRQVRNQNFDPSFKTNLFFVHLKRKQNSRDAIAHYRQQNKQQLSEAVRVVSQITDELLRCKSLADFENLMDEHEKIISSVIQIPPIKKQLFPDFSRSLKSLGGWGGDFILATGGKSEQEYFIKKGFHTILGYDEMVKFES